MHMKTFVHSDIAAHTRSTMVRYVYALIVTIWLAAAGLAHAGITDAVKFETLPNGLQVLLLENHKAPVATFNVFYKVGSRNEQFVKTGISNLCEHLMFRGTKKLKPEEFSNSIQENVGQYHSRTQASSNSY